jgi:SAM-dependent methyltransferase
MVTSRHEAIPSGSGWMGSTTRSGRPEPHHSSRPAGSPAFDEPGCPAFDEADYLAANSDVAEAVAAGLVESGLTHYLRHGANENRSLKHGVRAVPFKFPFRDGQLPPRRDKILAGLDLPSLEGVEIGALAAPLVTSAEGKIVYVDHADTASLQQSYRMHMAVDVSRIVAVDGVWGDNTLEQCLGLGRKVDYVVASHVIEHAPDLITWLAEIRAILRPDGTLRLAIPDRRYSFDYLRPESRIHDVLDAYLRRARIPLPRMIVEHHGLLRHVNVSSAWDGTLDPTTLEPYSTTRYGLELARDALENGTYHDVHCWIFTPLSFAEMCVQLTELDLLDFACGYFIETPRFEAEFFVSMVVSDSKSERIATWDAMRSALLTSETYQRP